ncbi:MAG: Type 1 glutamine amidotransferase-like domain-containing protein [Pseudobacteriovorax sp.]|nr:Type 1 glutamine amidotransferase-like domain-containing protein [Pseudobacteriovorax sp.]
MKIHPKLLFIPTAISDSVGYCQIIENVYGKQLGCEVEHLF